MSGQGGPAFMQSTGSLMLVEDEHVLRGLVAQFLRGTGYDIVEATDGPEAVAKYGEDGPFDLILLDLNLPGFSGVEVARRILRQTPRQNFLVCSAAIIPEFEDGLRALGIDHFLTKPYHPEVLLDHIARELRPRLAVIPSR